MFGRIDPIPAPLRFSELARLIPSRELRRLELLGTMLHLPEGRVAIHEGAIGRECMIVADGGFTVSKAGEPVAHLAAGDLMGELALITRTRRTASVTATTDSVVYVFNPREFRTLLDECPELALLVHRTAEDRVTAA